MLPWAEMVRAALSAGVPVSDFWRLSVREWRWLSKASGAHELDISGLSELMKNYPDKEDDDGRV